MSSTQLDASASVPETFVYTPSSGTLLRMGTQTLTVSFTPTDTVNYNKASATVSINVVRPKMLEFPEDKTEYSQMDRSCENSIKSIWKELVILQIMIIR